MKINKKAAILGSGLSMLVVIAGGVIIGKGVEYAKLVEENKVVPPVVINYEDETAGGEGIVEHYFEAEDAILKGVTVVDRSIKDHLCPALSYTFNEHYHGYKAVKNFYNHDDLKEKNQIIFNITSNKNVKAIMDLGMSVARKLSLMESAVLVPDLFTIYVNGRANGLNTSAPVGDDLVSESGEVHPTIKLKEGDNQIIVELKKKHIHWDGNIDYINIHTSAELGFIKNPIPQVDIITEVFPTSTRQGYGKIRHSCGEQRHARFPSIQDGLASGYYVEKVNAEDNSIKEYTLPGNSTVISSNPLPKTTQHKLTIVDPTNSVKFSDGANSKMVYYCYEFPEFTNNKFGYKVNKFVNADNPNEEIELSEFYMPKKDLRVAPVFTNNNYIYNGDEPHEGAVDFFNTHGKPADIEPSAGYKPFHSNGSTIKGFKKSSLAQQISHGAVKAGEIYYDGAHINYGSYNAGDRFVMCADTFTLNSSNNKKYISHYHFYNLTNEVMDFTVYKTNMSGQAFNESNPHEQVILQPGEAKEVKLSMAHMNNGNTLAGYYFNKGASRLKLGVYVTFDLI